MAQADVGRSVTNAMGRTIYVCDEDPRGTALIEAGGDFNPGSLAMWGQLLRSRGWDLVVDVGANYGEMLLGVELPEAAEVVAFEPDPAVCAHLQASLAEAGVSVDVRAEALAATVGEAEFLVDPSWSGTSRLATGLGPDVGFRRALVPTTTLDAVFLSSTAKTACIKIDVEGAEDLVLQGGANLFRRLDDVAVLIEILHRSPEELVGWATTWRMYVFDLRSQQLIRVLPGDASETEHLLSQDWIYRQDAVLRPLLEK